MARRGFSSGRSGIKPPQRQINNFAQTGEMDGITTATAGVKALGTGGISTLQSSTVVRTRGIFCSKVVSGVPAGNSIIRGAFGIIIVSADAFTVGITAIPGPLSDSDNDWYVWAPFCHLLQSGDDEGLAILANVTMPFDSRGMRKVKVGDVSAVVIEYASDTNGTIFDVTYAFREQAKT